jgi:hypothetical protein
MVQVDAAVQLMLLAKGAAGEAQRLARQLGGLLVLEWSKINYLKLIRI